MWVRAGDLGKVIAEEGARVGGRGPLFAELEDELADLGDECDVTVCGARGQLPAEERPGWEQLGCHGGLAEESESRCVRASRGAPASAGVSNEISSACVVE